MMLETALCQIDLEQNHVTALKPSQVFDVVSIGFAGAWNLSAIPQF